MRPERRSAKLSGEAIRELLVIAAVVPVVGIDLWVRGAAAVRSARDTLTELANAKRPSSD